MTPEEKKRDVPVIVATVALLGGFVLWLLASFVEKHVRGPLSEFPVSAALALIAVGIAMALALPIWRAVRHFFQGASSAAASPQAEPKAPVVKPIHMIMAGIILFVSGINFESGEAGLLSGLGEFVVLLGIILLLEQRRKEN